MQQARQCTCTTRAVGRGKLIGFTPTDRVQKLKDARAEATKEIEEYKKAKEQEFKAFESSVRPAVHLATSLLPDQNNQHAGITSEAQVAVDRDTEVKLKAITDSYEAHKEQVVKKLLDRVVLVKPELHRNLRKLEA